MPSKGRTLVIMWWLKEYRGKKTLFVEYSSRLDWDSETAKALSETGLDYKAAIVFCVSEGSTFFKCFGKNR
jgi:hypothetical protein